MAGIRVPKRVRAVLCALFVGLAAVSSTSLADMVDLTTADSSGELNDALFVWTDLDRNSTGTGVIDSFVVIQNNGIEQGYNTDGALEFDTKEPHHTRDIRLNEVPIMDIDGTLYREFLLDINQNTGQDNELLSLDDVEIYLADSGMRTGYSSGLGTMIWGLDEGVEDNYVKLDYSLNPGSGKGDMFMYVPDSEFELAGTDNPFVYLYSRFGEYNDGEFAGNDGAEEWAIRLGTTTPPEIVPLPGAVVLASMGLGAAGFVLRRRKARG